MLTPLSANLPVELDVAKQAASDQNPSILKEINQAQDLADLERILTANNTICFVDVTLEMYGADAERIRLAAEAAIEAALDDCHHEEEPPPLSQDDLVDICAPDEEDIPNEPVDISEMENIIAESIANLKQATDKVEQCSAEIKVIGEKIITLIPAEQDTKAALMEAERTLYEHRVLKRYYEQRKAEIIERRTPIEAVAGSRLGDDRTVEGAPAVHHAEALRLPTFQDVAEAVADFSTRIVLGHSQTGVAMTLTGQPTGTLYSDLYGILGEVNILFTREERGLKDDDTLEEDVAYDFYRTFPAKHAAKVEEIKIGKIEPAIEGFETLMRDYAVREIREMDWHDIFFSSSTADTMIALSDAYAANLLSLQEAVDAAKIAHDAALAAIAEQELNLKCVPCSGGGAGESEMPAGTDPLGITSLAETNPAAPNFSKHCYWLKFAKLATVVGLLPIVGSGGFRYWPIGLTVPSPSGIVKIPLPIVWIPLAVIPLPVGVFVIFIAQCGICPSPVVFFMGPNGEKKFVVSLRPGTDFGSPGLLKGTITIPVPTMSLNVQIPEFPALPPSEEQVELDRIKSNILGKIHKLKLPKIPQIPSTASVEERLAAVKISIKDFVGKLDIPDYHIPRNPNRSSPAPLAIQEMVSQVVEMTKLDLPALSLPTLPTINVTEKFTKLITDVKVPEKSITIPTVVSGEKVAKFQTETKDALKEMTAAVAKKIDPKTLGISMSALALVTGGLAVFNPYQCKPGPAFTIPPIPEVMLAITAITIAVNAAIDAMNIPIPGGIPPKTTLSTNDIKDMLTGLVKSLPPIVIPDPSDISLKKMFLDAIKALASIQLPTIPSPPIQMRVTIPGSMVTKALGEAVAGLLDTLHIPELALLNISEVDIKRMAVDLVESSFQSIETVLQPIFAAVALLKAVKGKTFPEMLGMIQIPPLIDPLKFTPVVLPVALLAAMATLKVMEFIPYPVVAAAAPMFKNLHPILEADDIPPWERLSLSNFLFVSFLDDWAVQGKRTCGLFENP